MVLVQEYLVGGLYAVAQIRGHGVDGDAGEVSFPLDLVGCRGFLDALDIADIPGLGHVSTSAVFAVVAFSAGPVEELGGMVAFADRQRFVKGAVADGAAASKVSEVILPLAS